MKTHLIVNNLISILLLLSSMCASASAQSSIHDDSAAQDFRQIVHDAKAKVFPAVVFIKCVRETHARGEKSSQQVTGSGVIITQDGKVLTNWHVVDKAQSIRCLLSDGQHMHAETLGSDKDTDLALLQLNLPDDVSTLPYADIGDSTVLSEGDFVMAMGAPYSLNRSVSIGIISCTHRFLPEISEYSLWLQTDAAINPGNSGGPLVNTAGEIIGINARGIGFAEGMGFAIPANTVKQLVPQLRDHGKVNWSWTGLQLQALKDFNRDMYFDATEGVIVAETDPESPARRAGIMARDRITSINGTPVTAMTEEDLPAVRRALGFLEKDVEAEIEIMRGDEPVTLNLTPREKGKVEGDELECKRWDLTVKTINQFDNPDLFFYRKSGVFIYGVKYPGNAANAGLRSKDIIVKIDGKDVETLDDVSAIHEEAIDNINSNHRILFVVLRNGLMRQVVLDFARDYSKE